MPVTDIVFRSQPEEFEGAITEISGAIPHDLTGTLLRNGPGLQTLGADALCFYDGLGMVSAISFRQGRAYLRSRHVKTPVYRASVAKGAMTSRGVFTNLPRRLANVFNVKLANPAQHDVFAWGGHIFATGDSAHYRLDGRSLETIGHERYGAADGHTLGLMPRIDPRAKRLVLYTMKPRPMSGDELTFVELDEEMRRVHVSAPVAMRYSPSLVHDLGLSEHYYVVVEPPLKASLGSLVFGAKFPWACFEPQADASALAYLVPRAGGDACKVALPSWVRAGFHFVNAFDDGETVTLDMLVYASDIDFISSRPDALNQRERTGAAKDTKSVVMRFRIHTGTGAVTEQKLSDWGEQPDIPIAHNGMPYRFGYMREPMHEGAPPKLEGEILWWHGVKKIDFSTGAADRYGAGEGRFVGAPAFAPRTGVAHGEHNEDDGYVLVWVVDARTERAEVLILDARSIAAGPVATLTLPTYVPPPGHVAFSDGVDCFP